MIFMKQTLTEPISDEHQVLAADMNEEKSIDIYDAVILQKILLGI